MNISCLNDIITEDLILNIDINNVKSWDLNNNYIVSSLVIWKNAIYDNINLYDFGLTAFDIGRTNLMWSGITITPDDKILKLYRIGYNDVINPSNYETSGITTITTYPPISATSVNDNKFFNLNGGYLIGFFKLHGYNYQLLPTRYYNGITIETILYLHEYSNGIFLMLGARAEDKYNSYFSGETVTGLSQNYGIYTSEDNLLNALLLENKLKKSFSEPENKFEAIYIEKSSLDNLKNNLIAFEITGDRHIEIKYINGDGLIKSNKSTNILTNSGFTIISIVYIPDEIIDISDTNDCIKQRNGDLYVYVNGRLFWKLFNFPEFYFKSFYNDREKQIGVPYSISWGGGSFGLKHSWHYDIQKYLLYSNNDINYINTNFNLISNPIINNCNNSLTGNTIGLSFNVDNTTFVNVDTCNTSIENPINVFNIKYIGNVGVTNISYFIKYNNLISVISNREYEAELIIYNNDFFINDGLIKIIPYSDICDILITDEIIYKYPLNNKKDWSLIKCKFKISDNIGQQFINIGFLIETNDKLNSIGNLFVGSFSYTGQDILVKDNRKNNLLIEQNFDKPFIGGIQKLRIYEKSLTSTEILHNAYIESQKNSNIIISKGGRLIYK